MSLTAKAISVNMQEVKYFPRMYTKRDKKKKKKKKKKSPLSAPFIVKFIVHFEQWGVPLGAWKLIPLILYGYILHINVSVHFIPIPLPLLRVRKYIFFFSTEDEIEPHKIHDRSEEKRILARCSFHSPEAFFYQRRKKKCKEIFGARPLALARARLAILQNVLNGSFFFFFFTLLCAVQPQNGTRSIVILGGYTQTSFFFCLHLLLYYTYWRCDGRHANPPSCHV